MPEELLEGQEPDLSCPGWIEISDLLPIDFDLVREILEDRMKPLAMRLGPMIRYLSMTSTAKVPWEGVCNSSFFEVITELLRADTPGAAQMAMNSVSILIEHIDLATAKELVNEIAQNGVLDLFFVRFRSRSDFCPCLSLAQRLLSAAEDDDFAVITATVFRVPILRHLRKWYLENIPPELWSFLRFLSSLGLKRVDRFLKRYIWIIVQQVFRAGVDVVSLPMGCLDLMKLMNSLLLRHPGTAYFFSGTNLPELLSLIITGTEDPRLAKQSLRVLALITESAPEANRAISPSWFYEFSIKWPEEVESGAVIAFLVFSNCSNPEPWISYLHDVVEIYGSEPGTDFGQDAKVFHTVCFAHWIERVPDTDLPDPADFIPFLCDLLASKISVPHFVDGLLYLLTQYGPMCRDDSAVSDVLLSGLDGISPPFRLFENLANNHHNMAEELLQLEHEKARIRGSARIRVGGRRPPQRLARSCHFQVCQGVLFMILLPAK
jgi:hypothetical protein